MNTVQMVGKIKSGELDEKLVLLYGRENVDFQRKRYINALSEFESLYGKDRDVFILSVPGRTEVSGNHTDHNHGKVIAAAIDLDIIAVAAANGDSLVRVKSEGFDEDVCRSDSKEPDESRFFTSEALISGMCRGMVLNGHKAGGFDAYTTSSVLKGSGLSSSAAFEVMIGTILNYLYNGGSVENPEIARIAQYAENKWFGKPCGLMDQTACAVGGFAEIDFEDPDAAKIEKVDFDLRGKGYTLCITDTGGNHADLNAEYAALPTEMKSVAKLFNKEVLRGLTFDELLSRASEIREKLGDRALLRAIHFINENGRVEKQAAALKEDNFDLFLELVKESGRSSEFINCPTPT